MVQHNLAVTPQRLWYMGPMFRYERPQKGRQRQFHQLGVEAFGVATPDQDAELIVLCQLWCRLGVDDALQLEINTIGSRLTVPATVRPWRIICRCVVTSLMRTASDALRRTLRILDSKNPDTWRS